MEIPADVNVVLRGGTVRSVAANDGDDDNGDGDGTAVLVRAGRVVAVGDGADLAAASGPRRVEIDLEGATVIPGLVDTHPHLMHYAILHGRLVDIADAPDHAAIAARIAARAEVTEPGEWIMTTPVGEAHYFLRKSWRDLREGVLPDRHVLDRVSPDHPVLVQAWAPVTPNVAVFNSRALELLGIDGDTPAQVGKVSVEKDERGEPTGRFFGSVNNYYNDEPFWDGLLAKVPLRDTRHAPELTVAAMSAYNAKGVTTVYEGHAMGHGEIRLYGWLRSQDRLSMRVLCCPEGEVYGMPWIGRRMSDDEFVSSLDAAAAMVATSDDWLRVDGVTFARFGPCWPGFLGMREPYPGPYGAPTTGVAFMSRERQRRTIEYCAGHGLRLNIISVGLAEHDQFLEDLDAVAAVDPTVRDRHWILQHGYLMEPAQAERYANLGFDMTTSMSFSFGKGDLFAERMGDAVLEHLVPLRRLLDAGLTVAAGSDWGPKNHFEQLQLSLTHRFASGRTNLGEPQRIDRLDALKLWTANGGRVLGWEGIGSLTPGAHADLAIIDRDPLTCAVEEMHATEVLATVVGGRVVHDAGALG